MDIDEYNRRLEAAKLAAENKASAIVETGIDETNTTTVRKPGFGPVQRFSVIMVFVVINLVIGGVLLFEFNRSGLDRNSSAVSASDAALSSVNVSANDFQEIFLNSGQAYFGKITGVTPTFVKMNSTYYLQFEEQPSIPGGNPSKLSLVDFKTATVNNKSKLLTSGSASALKDTTLKINRSDILFWKNVEPTNNVVQSVVNNGIKVISS